MSDSLCRTTCEAAYHSWRLDPKDCAAARFDRPREFLYLEIFTGAAIEGILVANRFAARGFGGWHAPTISPRQLKEVIQVTHIEVGSVASLGALVGGEVR
jgi:hypothetical protein